MKSNTSLTIGWLYPELMSTYGDRGNILVLQKRCEWRGIEVTIQPLTQQSTTHDLQNIDLIFGGGAQDKEQSLVMEDLRGKKGTILKEKIEANTPALFVCGSPQLMGNYYEPAEGKKIEGLGIFDMVSVHPGIKKSRLIGNIIGEIHWENLSHPQSENTIKTIVGFENHGGRTYLGNDAKPFARVLKGYGNNGEDGIEGVVYKNAIGSYLHGPLLPKNPQIADFLIAKALEVKYRKEIQLTKLDDTLEYQAQHMIAKKLGLTI